MQENFEESSTTSASVASTTLSTVTTITGDGIATPTPFQPGMIKSCNEFHPVSEGDTCASISTEFGITLTQFETWNPAVGTSCEFLGLGDFVCVNIIGFTITTSAAPTTTIGNGITTPTPFQTGMVTNCRIFHLVLSGDTCAVVAAEAGVSVATFEAWNPAVGATCEFLDLGDYVCIGLIGGTPTTTTTTTTIGDGVATPTPFQSGMVSNCKTFHLVVEGDQCGTVAATAGISLAQFISWNPAVGSSCSFLDLGDFVCIAIL